LFSCRGSGGGSPDGRRRRRARAAAGNLPASARDMPSAGTDIGGRLEVRGWACRTCYRLVVSGN